MGAIIVVIMNIISEQPSQVALVQCNHMIQDVPSATLHPALGNAILPRTFDRRADVLDLHRPNRRRNFRSVLSISIKDEKSGGSLIGKRFPQLLDNPEAGRMACHMEVKDTQPIMADDKKAVEHAECNRGNSEEVHRRDSFSMIAQKSKPAFRKFRISSRFAHPAGNGSFGNIKAEHLKLTVDARCSLRWILGDHLEDQIPNLFRDSSSADLPAEPGDDSPIELKPSPMPLNDLVGKHSDKRLLLASPNLVGGAPEQFVD
jgi:hypothetical protein